METGILIGINWSIETSNWELTLHWSKDWNCDWHILLIPFFQCKVLNNKSNKVLIKEHRTLGIVPSEMKCHTN